MPAFLALETELKKRKIPTAELNNANANDLFACFIFLPPRRQEYFLNGILTLFARADADNFVDARNKNFPVANLAGTGALRD